MDDLFFVDVVQSLADLADYRADLGLLHSSGFAEFLEELSVSAELDEKVDVFGVLEVAVEGSDVAVGQVELNGKLTGDLVVVLLGLYLLLFHHLHPAEETCQFVLHQHHLTKLSLAHLLADLEIRFCELPRRLWTTLLAHAPKCLKEGITSSLIELDRLSYLRISLIDFFIGEDN